MRRTFIALATAATLIASTGTANASASTVGGTCKLSANWTVRVSASFSSVRGAPPIGTLRYAVVVSPGALQTGTGKTSWTAFLPNGSQPNHNLDQFNFYRDLDASQYTYRADIGLANIRETRIAVHGGSGDCSKTLWTNF